ncbi:hypothetical protein CDL15_Pgr014620 [Punica granatum]|uniref:NmrA-like domain-containing protein n=1 Tax=Punica granatum TaxID=22663 RepID=A0A218XZT0_PUNGR|nr:hypothetical protein CDL15_Pgr014620 [Punica granatum]
MYNDKRKVRRAIEEAGIPYTYICCNSIAVWPHHDNTHPSADGSFPDHGNGNVKAGTDIGKFTMKCVDDDRTLNKTVHFRPPSNPLSINELASLWEEKIGRKLPRVTITEDELLALAEDVYTKKHHCSSDPRHISSKSSDKPDDVEITSLYPDNPVININECFTEFAKKIVNNKAATAGQHPDLTEAPSPKPEALALVA